MKSKIKSLKDKMIDYLENNSSKKEYDDYDKKTYVENANNWKKEKFTRDKGKGFQNALDAQTEFAKYKKQKEEDERMLQYKARIQDNKSKRIDNLANEASQTKDLTKLKDELNREIINNNSE